MKSTSRSKAHVNRKAVTDLAELLGGDFREAIKTGVREYLGTLLLQVAEALMAGEVSELCGPRYERNSERSHVRSVQRQRST